jgi:hypothetical protein
LSSLVKLSAGLGEKSDVIDVNADAKIVPPEQGGHQENGKSGDGAILAMTVEIRGR